MSYISQCCQLSAAPTQNAKQPTAACCTAHTTTRPEIPAHSDATSSMAWRAASGAATSRTCSSNGR
eukprot:5787966-Prymnesium_polylepis.1